MAMPAWINTSPDQAKHREQQYRVADIGVDRAMKETIRPRRNMIHPPSIGQHADDGDTQNPVKPSRHAAPARRRISNHILHSLSGFLLEGFLLEGFLLEGLLGSPAGRVYPISRPW